MGVVLGIYLRPKHASCLLPDRRPSSLCIALPRTPDPPSHSAYGGTMLPVAPRRSSLSR